MNDENKEFSWGSLGESRWRELQQQEGATELQLRFACARHQGASATRAAALAGYSGDKEVLRRQGYQANNNPSIRRLVEKADLEAPEETRLTDAQIGAKIDRLIRGPDGNLALKAIELRQKREAAAKESTDWPDADGFSYERMVREIINVPFASTFLLGVFCDTGHTALSCIPMFHEIYWRALRDCPEYVEKLRSQQSAEMLQDLKERIADADYQRETRTKIWAEIGVDIGYADAQIHQVRSALIKEVAQ